LTRRIRQLTSIAAMVAADVAEWALYQHGRRRLGIPEAQERVDEAHARADARLAIIEQRRAARARFPRKEAA
jgi:hypothetical protein